MVRFGKKRDGYLGPQKKYKGFDTEDVVFPDLPDSVEDRVILVDVAKAAENNAPSRPRAAAPAASDSKRVVPVAPAAKAATAAGVAPAAKSVNAAAALTNSTPKDAARIALEKLKQMETSVTAAKANSASVPPANSAFANHTKADQATVVQVPKASPADVPDETVTYEELDEILYETPANIITTTTTDVVQAVPTMPVPETRPIHKVIFGMEPILPYSIEEAINRLRINISFLGTDVKKIMIVSSEPNEGKSFIALNLWKQMAEAGDRSILIDLDMRKSTMKMKYQLKREDGEELKGTSHFLSGDDPIEDVILRTKYEHGDILPNVDNIVNPSMLLESRKFSAMMEYMEEHYRYVFVDVPPLGLVSDGELIGSVCDGAVICVRGGVTSRNVIRRSIRQLERAGCPVLGIVLNRVGGAGSTYYHKYYGRHYGKYYGSKYYYNDQYYYSGK